MKIVFVLALSTFGPLILEQSQLGTGAVTRVVTDASGKSVSAAVIQLTNADTGLRRQTASSGIGDFPVPVLPTGRYFLTVERTGFSSWNRRT